MGFVHPQLYNVNNYHDMIVSVPTTRAAFILPCTPPPHVSVCQRTNSFRISEKSKMLMARRNRDYDDDLLTSAVHKIVTSINQPTPGVKNLALGYPLLLAGGFIALPLPIAFLQSLFFVAWAYLGRLLLDEESSMDQDDLDAIDEFNISTDFVAFGFAVVCSALLAPDNWLFTNSVDSNSNVISLISGFLFVGVIVSLVLGPDSVKLEQLSAEEELMDIWDRQYEKDDEK
jgi:hypothetical protein